MKATENTHLHKTHPENIDLQKIFSHSDPPCDEVLLFCDL